MIFELRTVEKMVFQPQKFFRCLKILHPKDIQVSDDGSIPTTFVLPAPVYLEPAVEYAMVIRSASARYRVFHFKSRRNDKLTQTSVSNQPYLGSLYKSQNGSVWEPSQWEDLKFTAYRADFVSNGSFEIYSPELNTGNKQIAKLLPNSISLTSRSVRIGIGSTLQDEVLTLGNTVIPKWQ